MKFQNLVGLTMNIKFINIWEQKPPDMTICDQNIIFIIDVTARDNFDNIFLPAATQA